MALSPQIPYLSSPASIVNLALDELGQSAEVIGDLTDGTPIAEASRRHYGLILRGLLRAAHWNFARKQAPLQLLGDVTAQDSSQTGIPVSSYVERPWRFAYAWPTDGVSVRWMPFHFGQLSSNGIPATTAQSPWPVHRELRPTRFLVSSSDQYPVLVGQQDWTQMPDFQRIEGIGPTGRRIILTDNPNAQMVYTRLVTTIEEWDPSFRQAMVAALKVVLAPVAIQDPKLRVEERDKAAAMAKIIIDDARVANGNDAGFPQTIDREATWISARSYGAFYGRDSGSFFSGWDSFSLGGSVF